MKEQKNDGVFAVFAHANSKGIQYEVNGRKFLAQTPQELHSVLSNESQEWKDAIDQGKPITLVIYACNAAANSYYDNHFTHRTITVDQTIAQKMSKYLYGKNKKSIVIAGDGYGVARNSDNKFLGFRQSESANRLNTYQGGFITISNGKKINKRKYAYTGKNAPKIGNRKKIE